MRRSIHGRHETARGQILVIVAGGLIGLLAITALVLEGGTLVLNRRDAQNSADLASVAGSRTVALKYTDDPTTGETTTQGEVYAAISGSLLVNDCAAPVCTWDAQFVGAGLTSLGPVNNNGAGLPNGSLGVRVGVTRSPGALIGRVLGFAKWKVSTEATAIGAKPSSFPSGIMLPIALCGWGQSGDGSGDGAGDGSSDTSDDEGDDGDGDNEGDCVRASNSPLNAIIFEPGQIYDLTEGQDAPGGFGWLSWNGSTSAGALSTSICGPNNISFSLDSPFDDPKSYGGTIGTNPSTGETWFPVDPGRSNSSSVRACLDGWKTSGATVLIPVYDIVTSGGSGGAYHITGVAAFVLTDYEQPAIDNIQGYFVKYYPYTDVPGGLGTQHPEPGDTTTFLGLVR